MRQRTGFTLIELMVCLGIIAVVAGILYPVISHAKQSAKISSSLLGLKRRHQSLMIYQADQDAAPTGTPAQMGLPCLEAENSLKIALKEINFDFKSSCQLDPVWMGYPGLPSRWVYYLRYAAYDTRQWVLHHEHFGGAVPLIVDTQCDFPPFNRSSDELHRGLCVTLDGNAYVKVNIGSIDFNFFNKLKVKQK
jgi:prepilin-type N-terminal cleavage/methylation domain-containing protein